MDTNRLEIQEREQGIEIDVFEMFYVLLNKAWIIFLVAVIFAGGAGLYTKKRITPQYKSTTMLFMQTSTTIMSLSDIQLGTQLTKDYTVFIKSRPVLNQVNKKLGMNLSYEGLAGKITTVSQPESRIMYITVTDPSPERAKKIVDKVAEVASTRIAEILKSDVPTIIEPGTLPTVQSSPNVMKNCMVGALAGFAMAVFIILLKFFMDDRIKYTEDIEKHLGLTVLGSIPIAEKERKRRKKPQNRQVQKK